MGQGVKRRYQHRMIRNRVPSRMEGESVSIHTRAVPPLLQTPRDVFRHPMLVLGLLAGLAPGMAVVLFPVPFGAIQAALIAATGGALVGAFATRDRLRGAVVGVVVCAGMTLGAVAWLAVRMRVLPTDSFWTFELVFGSVLGGVPGFWLWKRWFPDAEAQMQAAARDGRDRNR